MRHPVYALGDALVEHTCARSPALATLYGVSGHDALWGDFGPEGAAARAAGIRDFATRLSALPPATAPFDALAVRVIREHLDERAAYFDSAEPLLDLNNITSTFQLFPLVFDFMDTTSREGLEAVAARLLGLGAATEGYRALLAEGLRTGNVVARRQVEAAVQQGHAQAGARSLYRDLAARCAALPHADAALQGRLQSGGEAAHAAIGALTDWLDGVYLPGATDTDGVGRERYARAARRHLGAPIDLDETYAWGWEEIRRIEADMRAVAAEIRPGVRVREVVHLLDTDPAHAAALPEPFLGLVRARQARAVELLHGRHFDVPEAIRCIEVRLAPPGGKEGAYYSAPSEDFSRPGTIWYSPGARTTMPLWQEVTTAYHEGFPGHHLQRSVQRSLKDRLSRFHRIFGGTVGYAEGWALYAEQLMLELGLLEEPAYVLGMHAGQLARACRVVVDIGLHLGLAIPRDADFHPGEAWSFALAEEMMRDRAFLPASMAHSEVVRYLGWPAQAIAYKVGQREILALREARRRREGAAFDLARFHADVLGTGSVGLATLRETLLA